MAKRPASNHERLPTVRAYHEPILKALRVGGGSATVQEMVEVAARELGLNEGQLAIPHDQKRGARSEVSYRMAWARTQLRSRGLIEQAARGRWVLTRRSNEK